MLQRARFLVLDSSFSIDWCCFYYFVRNSLVTLLEALFAGNFSSSSPRYELSFRRISWALDWWLLSLLETIWYPCLRVYVAQIHVDLSSLVLEFLPKSNRRPRDWQSRALTNWPSFAFSRMKVLLTASSLYHAFANLFCCNNLHASFICFSDLKCWEVGDPLVPIVYNLLSLQRLLPVSYLLRRRLSRREYPPDAVRCGRS